MALPYLCFVSRRSTTWACEGATEELHVHSAHKQPKQRAHRQELRKCRGINRGNLQHAQHNHVEHHGPLAAPPVTSKAKHGGANGAQQQGQGDGGGHGRLGGVVVLCQLDLLDGEGVEVEGVGAPRGQADEEEEPVARRQLRQQADGVAQRHGARPLGRRLAQRVGHLDALLEVEQVVPGLARRRQYALGDGIGGLVGRLHGPRWLLGARLGAGCRVGLVARWVGCITDLPGVGGDGQSLVRKRLSHGTERKRASPTTARGTGIPSSHSEFSR